MSDPFAIPPQALPTKEALGNLAYSAARFVCLTTVEFGVLRFVEEPPIWFSAATVFLAVLVLLFLEKKDQIKSLKRGLFGWALAAIGSVYLILVMIGISTFGINKESAIPPPMSGPLPGSTAIRLRGSNINITGAHLYGFDQGMDLSVTNSNITDPVMTAPSFSNAENVPVVLPPPEIVAQTDAQPLPTMTLQLMVGQFVNGIRKINDAPAPLTVEHRRFYDNQFADRGKFLFDEMRNRIMTANAYVAVPMSMRAGVLLLTGGTLPSSESLSEATNLLLSLSDQLKMQ
jgi:hypothetical protein